MTRKPRIHTVGRGLKGDVFFLTEVDVPQEGNLHHWRVIKIPVRGRRTVLGSAVAFGIEECFADARRKALGALKEALED